MAPSHHGTKRLGPTGEHPDGKTDDPRVQVDDDHGEIIVNIRDLSGLVALDFGRSVAWVGMTANEARGLSRALGHMADVIDNKVKREKEKEDHSSGSAN